MYGLLAADLCKMAMCPNWKCNKIYTIYPVKGYVPKLTTLTVTVTVTVTMLNFPLISTSKC